MIRTSHSVSIGLACFGGLRSGTSRSASPAAMPSADAIDADHQHLTPVGARMRTLRSWPLLTRPLLKPHGGGILCERDDERGSAVAPRTRSGGAVRRAQPVGPRCVPLGRVRWRGSPTARRPGSGGTPWRTGRAGGSRRGARPRARSAPRRGQHLGGLLHAHAGQVVAERGLADLGVGALELAARRGDAAGDVVEREVGGVLAIDDLRGLVEQARCGGGWWRVVAWARNSIRSERAQRMTDCDRRTCHKWRVAAHLTAISRSGTLAAIVAKYEIRWGDPSHAGA